MHVAGQQVPGMGNIQCYDASDYLIPQFVYTNNSKSTSVTFTTTNDNVGCVVIGPISGPRTLDGVSGMQSGKSHVVLCVAWSVSIDSTYCMYYNFKLVVLSCLITAFNH